jgi:hypothetical protein
MILENINIDLIILLIISFIAGYLLALNIKKPAEHIVNLDDSRKVELSKCCTDSKCYYKPPHLRDNCNKNKENAKVELEQEFKQMYTQEEYYKKLEDLGITKKGELNNQQIDAEYIAKMNLRVVLNPALDEKTDIKIRKDDRDEVRGYDMKVLAPYTK